MKRTLSILLALLLVLSLSLPVLASGDPSGETSAAPAEEGGPKAVIVYGDQGEDAAGEQTEGFRLTFFDGGGRDADGIHGFSYASDRSDAALFYSEPGENAVTFTIGGTGSNVVPDDASEAAAWLRGMGVEAFDSAIDLADGQAAAACPPVISAKGWTNLLIQGVYLKAAGAARSAFYSDVSGGSTVPGPGAASGAQGSETPVVIVSRSLLETTGSPDAAGEIAVGQSGGRARGIQPQGKSVTYLFNSAIVSRTWGAWSTDSARQSLDLIAWRSLGQSQGGYGAYADTSCRLFLYGSTLLGSSDGIVASNDGEIYASNSDCRLNSTELRAIMGRSGAPRDLCWQGGFQASLLAPGGLLTKPGTAGSSCTA